MHVTCFVVLNKLIVYRSRPVKSERLLIEECIWLHRVGGCAAWCIYVTGDQTNYSSGLKFFYKYNMQYVACSIGGDVVE